MINRSIFKSYDVRGIYPSELNEQAAFAVGVAFALQTGAKNVVVCQDARLSSPALFNALAAGLLSKGVQVTSIGQLPTECTYFAISQYDFDGAIMITASHNPKEYNGFKMMVKKGNDIAWIRGKDLLGSIDESLAMQPLDESAIIKKDILLDYITFLQEFSGKDMRPLRIVVDASNGVMGTVISQIKYLLPIEIIELHFQPDGNFPNHSPNPLEKGSVDKIKKAIIKNIADFGIMFDGDGDRIFLVDEQGTLVSADVSLALLAKYFLQKHPGQAVAYNLWCSRALPEFIKTWGGVPVRTAVGFVNVRAELMAHEGIMGGETSAHYCFRDYFYCDSGMMAFLTLLQIINADGRKVSQMVKELSPYVRTEESFKIENKEAVLEALKVKYVDGKQDFLDGITVEYQDWWFNCRPSNTEPLLRLTIEADTQELLVKKQKEIRKCILGK